LYRDIYDKWDLAAILFSVDSLNYSDFRHMLRFFSRGQRRGSEWFKEFVPFGCSAVSPSAEIAIDKGQQRRT